MALELEFLQNIVDVHWGGGKATFIVGTYKGSLYYADLPDTFATAVLPVTGIFRDPAHGRGFFYLCGSSRGAGQFLVCGMGSELSGLSAPNDIWNFFAFICSSSDGVTWQQVYKGPQGSEFETFIHPWTSESNALVWKPDEGTFYYSMLMNKFSSSAPYLHEQIFSSANGTAWSGPISDRSVLVADNGGIFKSNFPSAYCSHNECLDARGQHVPDGVMSTFSATKRIAMRPTTPPTADYTGGRAVAYWPETPSNTIEIMTINADGITETSTKEIPGIVQVTAVGGNGSTWMAGGWNDEDGNTGAIAFSVDAGETWEPGPAVDSGVVTLAWAPADADL